MGTTGSTLCSYANGYTCTSHTAPAQQMTHAASSVFLKCTNYCITSASVLPAGDVYEHAVLLALKSQSEAALESTFTQLKTFYADTRCVACASRHGSVEASRRQCGRSNSMCMHSFAHVEGTTVVGCVCTLPVLAALAADCLQIACYLCPLLAGAC
jgi:hypothetical protein